VLLVRGEYQVKPELPFIVGGEASGMVIEVGARVTAFAPGDRVLVPGGCVEQVVVAASRATRLPPGVDLEAAAAFRSGGRGADVIYDPVGGDMFDESMRCVAPFGRILVVGFTSGRAALAKTNHLLIKDASVIGFTIGALQRHDPAWARRNGEILVGWLASGRIHPYISHRLPLERTAEALQLIIDRKVIGKAIVL
jgi:NADPH:quinone reductase-like Zn-dependent oxidoreductase